jgi:hypothetical protein
MALPLQSIKLDGILARKPWRSVYIIQVDVKLVVCGPSAAMWTGCMRHGSHLLQQISGWRVMPQTS